MLDEKEIIETLENLVVDKYISERKLEEKDIEAILNIIVLYRQEKEKNSKAIAHIEACKTSLGNYILSPNETEYLLEILKEE